MTLKSAHISVSINRPANEVYEFVSNLENLPEWAAGLSGSIKKVGEDWVADSPMGTIKIKFVGKNEFGVLDHDVTLPSGDKIYNPMRVGPMKDMEGKVLTAVFELEGQRFMALDGGPMFKFNESVSFYVECETQEKFGLSWQIIPKQLGEYLSDPDKEKAGRVMQAMLQMKKIDIEELKQAYKGEK